MRMVFLDTVGIIGLFDEDDQWHAGAAEAFERVRSTGGRMVMTPHILWECGNAAARRPYRRDVAELRHTMHQQGRLLDVTRADEETAWSAYQTGAALGTDLRPRLWPTEGLFPPHHDNIRLRPGGIILPIDQVEVAHSTN